MFSGSCFAQEKQTLEAAANDPTAPLMAFQAGDIYVYNYHNADYSDNSISLRAAIPFKIGNQNNLMRITLPIITSNPFLDSGIGDVTIFDMATFDRKWGRFGVGAVALLPLGGSDRGLDKWAIGPALGFVNSSRKGFLFGVFNQNLFTVAGDDNRPNVNISSLQPILNKQLGSGWSVGFSEMQITYDWENSRWSGLPLGIGISKLHKFNKVPVQFNLQAEHNFQDSSISPSDLFRFNIKVLLPTL